MNRKAVNGRHEVVIGSLKIRSHWEKTRLLEISTLRRS